MISEVPKCSKIKIFRGSAPDRPGPRWGSLQRSPDPLTDGQGVVAPCQEPYRRSRPFGSRFYRSTGLKVYPNTELAILLMIDFKCRPIKFVFFPVSDNGEYGFGDERVDGAMPPHPQNFWARTAPACDTCYCSVVCPSLRPYSYVRHLSHVCTMLKPE